MNPLTLAIVVACIVTFVTWLLSVITNDNSQVDRIWSIVPQCYIWIWSAKDHFHNNLLLICAILTTAWGARLTFNFARKGGYRGEEDYRWEIVRKRMTSVQFKIFNIFFIAIYQNFLLFIIALPAYYILEHSGKLNAPTWICIVLFILALIGETTADQQQWNFHQAKKTGKTNKRFLDQGLFSISRHPNFFFEQSQWWLLYLIGGFSTNHLLNYSILGAILLTLLFLGSTNLTENISLGKYPEYADYQKSTSAIIPWIGMKKRK